MFNFEIINHYLNSYSLKKITLDILLEYISTHQITLSPTQNKLCIPIINRIYQKMVHNIKFDDIKIYDGLIIDGHHRYISSLLANYNIGYAPTHKTSATKVHKWENVEFVIQEWDTPEKIVKLNQDDADFNSIPLERIVEIAK